MMLLFFIQMTCSKIQNYVIFFWLMILILFITVPFIGWYLNLRMMILSGHWQKTLTLPQWRNMCSLLQYLDLCNYNATQKLLFDLKISQCVISTYKYVPGPSWNVTMWNKQNLFGNILIRSEIILCPFRHPVYVWLVTQLEILMAHMEAQGKIGLLRSSVMRILRSKIHCRKRVSLLLTILQYKRKTAM